MSAAAPWGTVEIVELAEDPACAHCGANCWQSKDGLTQRCQWCSSINERDPDVEQELNGKLLLVRTWSRRSIRERCLGCDVKSRDKYCAVCTEVRARRGLR